MKQYDIILQGKHKTVIGSVYCNDIDEITDIKFTTKISLKDLVIGKFSIDNIPSSKFNTQISHFKFKL